jgi:hypothetical protein
MLDITFYSQAKATVDTVEIEGNFYKWLAQSEFSKLGKAEEIEMKPDGEAVKINVIRLEGGNRRKFSDFFRDEIVQESDEVLNKLGTSPSKQECADATSRLRTLQSLRKLVENEECKYLELA